MITSQVKRIDYFWAACSGALLVLSFPTFNLSPAACFFLVPLLLRCQGKKSKDAFFLGVFAGVVAYIGLIYWIVVAVHTYGNIPLPLAIPILLLLAIFLSLYWGAFTFLISFIKEKSDLIALMAFPAFWVGLEYLRSYLLSGFPWALIGYSQYLNTTFIQIADITGVYGVSFLLVLINTLFFIAIVRLRGRGGLPFQGIIFTVALVALAFAYGYWRIHSPLKMEKGLKIGVAQGNIAQDVKWDSAFQKKTLTIYRDLTLKLTEASPGLIVWPETAFPSYFPSGTDLDDTLSDIVQEANTNLLFGSLSYKKKGKDLKIYNSAYLLSSQRHILGRYDKIHLVPLGEYVPLSTQFPLFNSLAGIGNITPGEETVIFKLPRGKFGVLICFEVIFPELCRRISRGGADFMVTITNDAWFGRTSAPYQHLAQATFRSVENRLWLVRAANTGVSAFIDPMGRIRTAGGIFTAEVLAGEIEFKPRSMTFYTKNGDLFAIMCSLLGICLMGFFLLKRQVLWF